MMKRYALALTRDELDAISRAAWAYREDTFERVLDAPESDGYTDEDRAMVANYADTLDRLARRADAARNILDKEALFAEFQAWRRG
jgi:hypothetical protein